MWQRVILIPLSVALAAPTSPDPMPDMAGVGQSLHGLSDGQTALYLMAVLLVSLLVERGLTGWRTTTTSNKLAEAIDGLRSAVIASDVQGQSNSMLIQYELSEAKRDRETTQELIKENQATLLKNRSRLSTTTQTP